MTRKGLHVTVALIVVLSAVVGAVGIAAAHQHKDGNEGNGEELKSGTDEDPIVHEDGNYTIALDDHRPGVVTSMSHFSSGYTENFTIHWIKVTNPHFDFSRCSGDNTRAFGIDRGNDDPGTQTDEPLLTAYRAAYYTEDYIAVDFYEEETLGGEPKNVTVADGIVARSADCYQTPSEPGWYRLNGFSNGSTTHSGDTNRNYNITDYSNWTWICDCENRQQAIDTLGPPPAETHVAYRSGSNNGGGGDGGGDGGGGDGSGDGDGDSTTPTATAGGGGGNGNGGSGNGDGGNTGDGDGDSSNTGDATTGTAGTATNGTATGGAGQQNGGQNGGGGVGTPTEGGGPGFGAIVALIGLLTAGLIGIRRAG